MTTLDPPPDGAGWWPTRFLVDAGWVDARGTAWRAVTNHPALQARRDGARLELRDAHTTHTYTLTAVTDPVPAYIAE